MYGHAHVLLASLPLARLGAEPAPTFPPRCPECGVVSVYVDDFGAYMCPTFACERVYVLVTERAGR